jgi:hypothetical protein
MSVKTLDPDKADIPEEHLPVVGDVPIQNSKPLGLEPSPVQQHAVAHVVYVLQPFVLAKGLAVLAQH